MSNSQNSDDYSHYKLIKELRDKVEYINDFTDVDNLENSYCDLCDRKLVEWENERLICPDCHIISDPKFTIVKRKAAREGPVDDDTLDGNDIPIISEYYQFKRQEEKPDRFIDSLKAQGYQIISSTKK